MVDKKLISPWQFALACVMVAIALYLIVGFIDAYIKSDWPKFWPPMDYVANFIESLVRSSNLGASLAAILITAFIVIVIAHALLGFGIVIIFKYFKQSVES